MAARNSLAPVFLPKCCNPKYPPIQDGRNNIMNRYELNCMILVSFFICDFYDQSVRFLSLSALPTTHTELRDMANPPSMGLKSGPPNRYRAPAATGIPSVL